MKKAKYREETSKKFPKRKQPPKSEYTLTLKMGGFIKKVTGVSICPYYQETFSGSGGIVSFCFKLEKYNAKKKTASYVLEDMK